MTIAQATARVNADRNHLHAMRAHNGTPAHFVAQAEAALAAAEARLEAIIEAAIAAS